MPAAPSVCRIWWIVETLSCQAVHSQANRLHSECSLDELNDKLLFLHGLARKTTQPVLANSVCIFWKDVQQDLALNGFQAMSGISFMGPTLRLPKPFAHALTCATTKRTVLSDASRSDRFQGQSGWIKHWHTLR